MSKIAKEYRALVATVAGPLASKYGTGRVQRLVGFFVCWHLLDGYAGMREKGWDKATIWRARKEFASTFGEEVEDIWPDFAAFIVTMR
jgi:hypothetical protein